MQSHKGNICLHYTSFYHRRSETQVIVTVRAIHAHDDDMAGMMAGENSDNLMIFGGLGVCKKKCQYTKFLENSMSQQSTMA